jgi:hypothetical protein
MGLKLKIKIIHTPIMQVDITGPQIEISLPTPALAAYNEPNASLRRAKQHVDLLSEDYMSEIGQNNSHYSVTEKIGKDNAGEVFQAKDQKLGRDAAMKVLSEEFA